MITKTYKLGEQCEHGSLARQCLICELQGEIKELKAENERLKGKHKVSEAFADSYMKHGIKADLLINRIREQLPKEIQIKIDNFMQEDPK